MIKRKFTQEEDEQILYWYKVYGHYWSKIAQQLKGRTGDMVKNRFYSSLRKTHSDLVGNSTNEGNTTLPNIVNSNATKIDVKNAVKEIFKVDVAKVNTINVKPTKKSQNTKAGKVFGKTSAYKKAIVTLTSDSKPIEFFESLN